MDFQLNEYVITKICGYLPLSDIKTVRSLNSLWNLGSSPILVAKGCNHLNIKDLTTSLNGAFYFAGNHFPCQAIKISLMFYNDQEHNQNIYKLGQLFAPNCKQLPPVSHIQLNHPIFNEADAELLNDILQYYSTSLKVLVLASDANWIQRINLRPSIKFPELKLIWNLMHSATGNLLDANSPFTISIKPFLLFRRIDQFSGLTRLVQDLKFGEIVFGNVSILGLQYLNRLTKNLRECVFGRFDLGEDKATLYRELETFLQIQANSLESLEFFNLPCNFMVKWPSFKNLKKLRLAFKDFGCKFEFGVNGMINYEQDFPKLESLILASCFRAKDIPESLVPVYDSFFPKNGNQICKSLIILMLPDRCLEVVKNLEERLKNLFPNAKIIY